MTLKCTWTFWINRTDLYKLLGGANNYDYINVKNLAGLTLTFVVDAGLTRFAVFVTSTAQHTDTVDTSLTSLALRVADTGDLALVSHTALSFWAVFWLPTHNFALSVDTHIADTVGVWFTACQLSQAALRNVFCQWNEFRQTNTHRLPIDDFTQSIRATGSVARVDTLSCDTSWLFGTVFVAVRTVSFRSTTFSEWISDMIWRASASVADRRSRLADGCWVTRVRAAHVSRYTFNIWQWVGFEATWTLTYWAMVFSDTYRIGSTSFIFTNIQTRVTQSVTKLMRRAVGIVNTWNSLTPWSIGVTSKQSRRTLALGYVVVSDTDCMRSTVH